MVVVKVDVKEVGIVSTDKKTGRIAVTAQTSITFGGGKIFERRLGVYIQTGKKPEFHPAFEKVLIAEMKKSGISLGKNETTKLASAVAAAMKQDQTFKDFMKKGR